MSETTATTYDPDLAAIGAIEPVFVDEFVGYAERRIVIDTPLVARRLTGNEVPEMVEWHDEPCDPTPQYRRTLQWRSTLKNGRKDADE